MTIPLWVVLLMCYIVDDGNISLLDGGNELRPVCWVEAERLNKIRVLREASMHPLEGSNIIAAINEIR